MSKEKLSFSISPEFVTGTARSWFWDEGKPWAVVEELLLACMEGTDKSREELVAIAKKIVFGEKKLAAPDNDSFDAMLVDDDQDLVIQHVEAMKAKIQKLDEAYKESQEELRDLLDRIEESGIRLPGDHLIIADDKEDVAEPSSLLSDDYGWLSPSGEFTEVEFGDHTAWAWEKVRDTPELMRFAEETGKNLDFWNAGDILYERGWILLHNPGMGRALVTRDETRPITTAQSDFLFSYYADRGYHKEAEKYL